MGVQDVGEKAPMWSLEYVDLGNDSSYRVRWRTFKTTTTLKQIARTIETFLASPQSPVSIVQVKGSIRIGSNL